MSKKRKTERRSVKKCILNFENPKPIPAIFRTAPVIASAKYFPIPTVTPVQLQIV